MSYSNSRLPRTFASAAKCDPEYAGFIAAEYEGLHAFAVAICERFGFSRADADILCDQATLLVMIDKKPGRQIREDVIRAWKSTLVNWISHELKDTEPSFRPSTLPRK